MKQLLALTLVTASLFAQTTGRVTGRVTAHGGQPLRAEISAITAGIGIGISTFSTDDRGAFAIEAPIGNVVLIVRADGYASEQHEIGVRPGQGNAPLRMSLSPAGTISGRVVDLNGSGVGGARVWLVYRGAQRSWRLGEESGGEPADAAGNFTISVVAQDRPFVLLAESEEYLVSSTRPMVLRGQELPGVSLLLSRRGSSVSERVVDASGRPVADAEVRLRVIPGDAEISPEQHMSAAFARSLHRTAVSGPDGSYRFSGVPAGQAVLSSGAFGDRAALDLTVTTEQLTNVELRLRSK